MPEREPGTPENGADPSMEDILASIRRILSEEETPPATPRDVLVLDQSMEVAPEARPELARPELARPELAPPELAREEMPMSPPTTTAEAFPPEPEPPYIPPERAPPPEPVPASPAAAPAAGLVAPETESAAASAMGGLVRRLALERQGAVYRGGPTVEDVVREEMRPLLKAWLDANLPALVEQLVREEIERVVKRASL